MHTDNQCKMDTNFYQHRILREGVSITAFHIGACSVKHSFKSHKAHQSKKQDYLKRLEVVQVDFSAYELGLALADKVFVEKQDEEEKSHQREEVAGEVVGSGFHLLKVETYGGNFIFGSQVQIWLRRFHVTGH